MESGTLTTKVMGVEQNREVWTGSLFSDPRAKCIGTVPGTLGKQLPKLRSAFGANLRPDGVIMIFLESEQFPLIKGEIVLESYAVIREDGRTNPGFQFIMTPAREEKNGFRIWYRVAIDPVGAITVRIMRGPDDRLARPLEAEPSAAP